MKYKILVLITALISINVFAQKAPFSLILKTITLYIAIFIHTQFSLTVWFGQTYALPKL